MKKTRHTLWQSGRKCCATIMLMLLSLQSGGCTVVGALSGRAIDSARTDASALDSADWSSLETGKEIEVRLKNHSVVHGYLDSIVQSVQVSHANGRADTVSVRVPPGRRLIAAAPFCSTLVLVNLARRSPRLAPLSRMQRAPSWDTSYIPLSDVAKIRYRHGGMQAAGTAAGATADVLIVVAAVALVAAMVSVIQDPFNLGGRR
jgi:hypothetical protein